MEPREKPKTADVRAQLERLKVHGFRGRKVQRLLTLLVEQWLLDGGASLSEKFLGREMNEPAEFEGDSGSLGYPKIRANMRHVRKRLTVFYETIGYRDRVMIKVNPGSYVPEIEYNLRVTDLSEIGPVNERIFLRAKIAIDGRTWRGAYRALEYYFKLEYIPGNARQTSNIMFIPYAVAPIFPNVTKTFQPCLDSVL
jgi:hypothetical protein